jgi:hypothetical protein
VPRIIFSSQNGNYQFQLSLLRANLIIQNDVSSKMEMSIELAEKISEVSLEEYSWTINRIGFVVKTVRECENGALKFLDEQYISNKLQKEEKQKEIHSLAKENWENELVNQWIRLKADGNYLNIIVDRNIVPNDDRELSQKDILSYLKISVDKIYKIIDGIMN